MESWKQSFWIATFEWKHSPKSFLYLLGILIVSLLLIRSLIPTYLEEASMGLDFYFLAFIFSGLLSQYVRPKDFQLQKITGLFYASPFLIALNQLAVEKEVIVTYKFLSYLFYYTLYSGMLLIVLYPSFQQVMTLGSYVAFSIIWFCFGIYIGCVNPTFEAHSNLGWNILYGTIFGSMIFIAYLFIFYKWYDAGLVSWTIYLATEKPLLASIISIVLAIIGWNFWKKIMLRKLMKTDYL